jgi:hypothetical protein
MDTFEAIMIAEGVEPATNDERQAAWQHLIDTGVCWNLQGYFGRTAKRLIDEGICSPPPAKQKVLENQGA